MVRGAELWVRSKCISQRLCKALGCLHDSLWAHSHSRLRLTSFILNEIELLARLDHPIAALARVALWSLHLHECFVERQIMTNAIVPSSLGIIAVVFEGSRDPFIYLRECQATVWGSENRHSNHLSIAVRRLVAIIFKTRHIFWFWQNDRLCVFDHTLLDRSIIHARRFRVGALQAGLPRVWWFRKVNKVVFAGRWWTVRLCLESLEIAVECCEHWLLKGYRRAEYLLVSNQTSLRKDIFDRRVSESVLYRWWYVNGLEIVVIRLWW